MRFSSLEDSANTGTRSGYVAAQSVHWVEKGCPSTHGIQSRSLSRQILYISK